MNKQRSMYALLILALASLACSTSLTQPIAELSEPESTNQPPSPAAAVSTATDAAAAERCEVTADGLYVRDAPAIEGTVIAWLLKDDLVSLSPDPPDGVWVKVITADNVTGWINSNYCERK